MAGVVPMNTSWSLWRGQREMEARVSWRGLPAWQGHARQGSGRPRSRRTPWADKTSYLERIILDGYTPPLRPRRKADNWAQWTYYEDVLGRPVAAERPNRSSTKNVRAITADAIR